MIIDFHVNLLPEWSRSSFACDLTGETDNLRRNFENPKTKEIHQLADASSIIAAMDRSNVDRAICLPYQFQDSNRCRDASSFLVQEIAKHQGRLYGLVVVQPRDPGSLDDLEAALSNPQIVGLKVKPRWGGFSLSDIAVLGPLCEILTQKNRILMTHLTQSFHPSTGDQLADLLNLLRSFPHLKVVAAHLGGFAGVYECYEPVCRHFDNLFIDISLPQSLAWLPHLMRLGNPNRYLFATDYPYTDFDWMVQRLDEIGLTASEREAVLGANAARLLSSLELPQGQRS
jgi:uncharacterized protein